MLILWICGLIHWIGNPVDQLANQANQLTYAAFWKQKIEVTLTLVSDLDIQWCQNGRFVRAG
jgi:hypothetical protein